MKYYLMRPINNLPAFFKREKKGEIVVVPDRAEAKAFNTVEEAQKVAAALAIHDFFVIDENLNKHSHQVTYNRLKDENGNYYCGATGSYSIIVSKSECFAQRFPVLSLAKKAARNTEFDVIPPTE